MSRVLLDFRCPIHNHELVAVTEWSGDESGVWLVTSFACEETFPPHFYPARSDGAGDWVPVDDEADEP